MVGSLHTKSRKPVHSLILSAWIHLCISVHLFPNTRCARTQKHSSSEDQSLEIWNSSSTTTHKSFTYRKQIDQPSSQSLHQRELSFFTGDSRWIDKGERRHKVRTWMMMIQRWRNFDHDWAFTGGIAFFIWRSRSRRRDRADRFRLKCRWM